MEYEKERFWINTQGQDVVEVKSMIDLVLVKKDMLRFVHDVSTVRSQITMLYCVKSSLWGHVLREEIWRIK